MAWAAGFFDGEGTVAIARSRARQQDIHELSAIAVNTKLSPLLRFKELWGGSIYGPTRSKNPHHAPSYRWQANGVRAARALREMLPYLVIKGEAAEVGLALQALKRRQGRTAVLATVEVREREALLQRLRELNRKGVAPEGARPVPVPRAKVQLRLIENE